MDNNLLVCSSPHLRSSENTNRIMLDVVIALIPAAAFGTYYFGARVLMVIAVTILSCLLSEYLSNKAMKRENTLGDFSAVITGLLLALNLPATIPYWIAAVGGAIAVVIVKMLFGGLGQNFMNPALAARVIMLVSWPVQMTQWVTPGADVVTSATPLAILKGTEVLGSVLPSYIDLFMGNIGGSIGETSVLALLMGACYLIYRKVITLEIPLAFIGTLAIFVFLFGGKEGLFSGDFLFHVLSGGLMLGAFFMATDYSTSPVTVKGKIIMGIGCGILTGVIRLFTNYPEGVSFAIILMNIVTPLIDRYTIPVSFGGEKASA